MSPSEATEKSRGKWRAVTDELRGRIESGRWKSGQRLPSVGELCSQLAITHPTLRKAMQPLVESGWVDELARGWRVANRAKWVPGTSIAFLRRCQADGIPQGEADRESFFRRALELEASRRGLRVETWGITEEGKLFRGRTPWNGTLRGSGISGMVVSLWHMDDPSKDLAVLHGVPFPLAIWDERSNEESRPRFPKVRWFSSGRARRSVAWWEGICWTRDIPTSPGSARSMEACGRCAGKGLATALGKSVKPARLRSFASTEHWDPCQFAPEPESVRKLMDQLVALTPETLRTELDLVVESGRTLLRDRELLDSLDGLFERALGSGDTTAWVCANDDIARLAWAWLSRHGRKAGEDIALVGFDNTLRSQDAGLTSASFLEEDLAVGMVAYLLDPGRWRSNGTVSLSGTLVVRDSSARRRNPA